MTIYLDNHATTPCDPHVVAAMQPYFTDHFGNASTRENSYGRLAQKAVAHAKAAVASLLHTQPEDVHFTSGATAANHWALRGIQPTDQRNELAISALEHDSIFQAAKASGLALRIIPATPSGLITEEALETVLSERTLLVSIQAANQEIGTVQDIPALAACAHAAGALFHCDATQAAGKMPLNARKVDMLSLSAHKLYGPQGIGALVIRSTPPLEVTPLHGGTIPLALAVGFGEACRIAAERMEADAEHARHLAALFLNHLPNTALNGDTTNRLAGSLNLRFSGMNAEDILLDCAEELSLSTASACTSARREPSHVLRAIGLSDSDIAASIRLCFGRFNTEDEALRAAQILNDRTQPARQQQAR